MEGNPLERRSGHPRPAALIPVVPCIFHPLVSPLKTPVAHPALPLGRAAADVHGVQADGALKLPRERVEGRGELLVAEVRAHVEDLRVGDRRGVRGHEGLLLRQRHRLVDQRGRQRGGVERDGGAALEAGAAGAERGPHLHLVGDLHQVPVAARGEVALQLARQGQVELPLAAPTRRAREPLRERLLHQVSHFAVKSTS